MLLYGVNLISFPLHMVLYLSFFSLHTQVCLKVHENGFHIQITLECKLPRFESFLLIRTVSYMYPLSVVLWAHLRSVYVFYMKTKTIKNMPCGATNTHFVRKRPRERLINGITVREIEHFRRKTVTWNQG